MTSPGKRQRVTAEWSWTNVLVHCSLGALLGFVLVSILTSMWLSLEGAHDVGPDRLNWALLGQIASFWSGHLSALAIVFVAMGLYLQSREILKQRELEAVRVHQDTVSQRKWQLRFLTSQLEAASECMFGWTVTYAMDGVRREPLQGASTISRALFAMSPSANRQHDTEVFVDPDCLRVYLALVSEIRATAKGIDDQTLQSLVSITQGNTVNRQLFQYADAQARYIARRGREMHSLTIKEAVAESITNAMKAGWTLDWYEAESIWNATAKRESVDGLLECSIEGAQSARDAIERLEREWTRHFCPGVEIHLGDNSDEEQ